MNVPPPPLTEPPLGPDAVYLMRVSKLRANGDLVGPYVVGFEKRDGTPSNSKPTEVILPAFGSIVDTTGIGIFGILGNSTANYFRAIKNLGEDVVARRYRFQVMSAWQQDVEVDWERPLSSRRARRAFVLFTGDEVWARITMHLLLTRGPHATFDNVMRPLRLSHPSTDGRAINPLHMLKSLLTTIDL